MMDIFIWIYDEEYKQLVIYDENIFRQSGIICDELILIIHSLNEYMDGLLISEGVLIQKNI